MYEPLIAMACANMFHSVCESRFIALRLVCKCAFRRLGLASAPESESITHQPVKWRLVVYCCCCCCLRSDARSRQRKKHSRAHEQQQQQHTRFGSVAHALLIIRGHLVCVCVGAFVWIVQILSHKSTHTHARTRAQGVCACVCGVLKSTRACVSDQPHNRMHSLQLAAHTQRTCHPVISSTV